jgi:hypothetical protein
MLNLSKLFADVIDTIGVKIGNKPTRSGDVSPTASYQFGIARAATLGDYSSRCTIA